MTVARVLEVARSQLGTVESPPNSNRTKYGQVYGLDGVAWCAIWCWWVFREAGVGHLIPKSAYTPAIADWYRARKQWGGVPRPGALALFDFPGDGVGRISHIGIVEAVNRDGSVVCIEGNTSAGTSGSQRDGGGVWRRTRRTGIVGYAYPAYPASPSPSTGGPELDAAERKMLTEVHAQLHNLFPTRADFAVLGQPEPAQRPRDTIGGFAVNADARAYETRELVRAARTEIAALTRLVESQQAAIVTVARAAAQGIGLTPDQIKDAVTAAIRDNLVRVEIAATPAEKD